MGNLHIGEQRPLSSAPQKPANRAWLADYRIWMFAIVILAVGALALGWNSMAAAGGGVALLLFLCCAVMMGGMMMMTKDDDRSSPKHNTGDDEGT